MFITLMYNALSVKVVKLLLSEALIQIDTEYLKWFQNSFFLQYDYSSTGCAFSLSCLRVVDTYTAVVPTSHLLQK